MTTETTDAISGQEYEALQTNELSDEEVQRMFMSRFKFAYTPHGGYKPKEEADYIKGRARDGYYIHYSFPQYYDKPVASVWTQYFEDGVEKFRIFHVDFDKFMALILNDLQNHGFNPPPMRKVSSYKKPVKEGWTEDDKPY
jgi:hypothetical protein